MKCPEVQELLSAYHDGELPPGIRASVATHLEECAACAKELAGFAQLSSMAEALPNPKAPSYIWPAVERRLAGPAVEISGSASSRWKLTAPRMLVLAASLLVAIGLTWWFTTGVQPEAQDHHPFTAEFGDYLAEFQQSPANAQKILIARYDGEAVDANGVVRQVGYRPAVSRGLPPGYTVDSTFVLDMPCCRCIQSLCSTSDGGMVAIFEHSDDDHETHWFGKRPSVKAVCQGRACRLVELENQIAASWKRGARYITVIGIDDLEEVNSLVAWFDGTGA